MRDKLKTLEYFNDFINEDLTTVNEFLFELERGEIKQDRIFAVKAHVHEIKLGILIARYSRGDEISSLVTDYLSLVNEWEDVWTAESYNKNLEMISLAVLFEVENSVVSQIKKLLKQSNINDWLLAFLINSLDGEPTDESMDLLFPKYYHTLKEAVYEEDKVKLLKRFLSKEWYRGSRCYNAHKSEDALYYGYWSFVSGAIAKILGLDDAGLKNEKYYPYDLVHYSTGKVFTVMPSKGIDTKENISVPKVGIPANKELEQIVPEQFHEIVNQIIMDYDSMGDEEFIAKYDLDDIWFTVEEYKREKVWDGLLGKVIINVLVEKGYVFQVDYKENSDVMAEEVENFWKGQEVRLVTFDLNTDQYYYAYIPQRCNIKSVYEVNIL